jgi:fucose 4-O-acetylase-like acetyltransferase
MSGLHEYVTQVMYAFRMPTLFFLSGLFLRQSVQKKVSVFVLDRLKTLIFPCLLWSIIQAAAHQAAAKYANWGPDFFDMMKMLPFHPFGELWFLYVLFAVSVLILALHKMGMRPGGIALTGIAIYLFQPFFSADHWGELGLACKFSPYVAAGFFLSSRLSPNLVDLPRRVLICGFIGSMTILCLLTPVVSHRSVVGGPLLAIFGVAGMIALSKCLARDKRFKVLRYVGSRSLPIYLAHPLATGGLRILIVDISGVRTNWFVIGIVWVGGLMFPICLDWFARRTRTDWIFSLRRERLSIPSVGVDGFSSPSGIALKSARLSP